MASAAIGPGERADVFVKAWANRDWINVASRYPAAPKDVLEMYETHRLIQSHELASELGGHGGYKLGGIGLLGETCIYAPLFKNFLVNAPAKELSSASYQLHQVEPEIGFIIGNDLPPLENGSAYTAEDIWAAVQSVVPCIECCGRRASAEVAMAQEPIGKLADLLSAGAVVLGRAISAADIDRQRIAACTTTLSVNGSEVSSGSAAACPKSDPVEAVAWLANHLNSRGLSLQKGQLVITGATCITKDITAGDTLLAEFAGMGDVEMTLQP